MHFIFPASHVFLALTGFAIWRTFKHFLRHRSHVSELYVPSNPRADTDCQAHLCPILTATGVLRRCHQVPEHPRDKEPVWSQFQPDACSGVEVGSICADKLGHVVDYLRSLGPEELIYISVGLNVHGIGDDIPYTHPG